MGGLRGTAPAWAWLALVAGLVSGCSGSSTSEQAVTCATSAGGDGRDLPLLEVLCDAPGSYATSSSVPPCASGVPELVVHGAVEAGAARLKVPGATGVDLVLEAPWDSADGTRHTAAAGPDGLVHLDIVVTDFQGRLIAGLWCGQAGADTGA